jgi:hypothetical protein
VAAYALKAASTADAHVDGFSLNAAFTVSMSAAAAATHQKAAAARVRSVQAAVAGALHADMLGRAAFPVCCASSNASLPAPLKTFNDSCHNREASAETTAPQYECCTCLILYMRNGTVWCNT